MSERIPKTVRNVVARALRVLATPRAAFASVAQESSESQGRWLPYVIVMSTFSGIFYLLPVPSFSSLKAAAFVFVSYLVSVPVIGGLMAGLASLFKAKRSWALSSWIVALSSTPVVLSAALGYLPILGMLITVLAMLWAIALFYLGSGWLLNVNGTRRFSFVISVGLIVLVGSIVPSSIYFGLLDKKRPFALSDFSDASGNMAAEAAAPAANEVIETLIQQSLAQGTLQPSEVEKARVELRKNFEDSSVNR